MKKREGVIVLLLVVALIFALFQWQRAEEAIESLQSCNHTIEEGQDKLLSVMNDHENCLRKQEAQLRLKLIHSYIQSLSSVQVKMDEGVVIDVSEREKLMARISYIIENMALLELKKDDSADLLLFLSKIGSRLKAEK